MSTQQGKGAKDSTPTTTPTTKGQPTPDRNAPDPRERITNKPAEERITNAPTNPHVEPEQPNTEPTPTEKPVRNSKEPSSKDKETPAWGSEGMDRAHQPIDKNKRIDNKKEQQEVATPEVAGRAATNRAPSAKQPYLSGNKPEDFQD